MTPQIFKIRYPQFEDISDGRIQYFINESNPWFNKDIWADFYEQGVGLWVAHQLAVGQLQLEQFGGGTGFITTGGSISVGPVSISDGSSSSIDRQIDNQFLSTAYGSEYMRLARMLGMGGVAI
jgi:hypothetical protein